MPDLTGLRGAAATSSAGSLTTPHGLHEEADLGPRWAAAVDVNGLHSVLPFLSAGVSPGVALVAASFAGE